MQKYLVVGCGGSGAKTQSFMIDQLKANLRTIDPEITNLPEAWQFVTIDVPIVPEKGPGGLANVEESGGKYVSIGSTQHYSQFDSGLSAKLSSSKALGEIATWATRHPETLNTPISDGAGQYRGIGRMLTIQNLGKIHSELTRAVDRLNLAKTNQELNALNKKITGFNTDKSDDQPVVLVISSMAGGAGASMFLDVCRILSTIPGIKPAHTAVFMLTPEVFESLSAASQVGAWPNSLALFGEAMAAQTGAAEAHDRAIFDAMAVPGSLQRTTFARMFPIGARMGGQGSRFGDGSVTAVYRGLARALAALMFSERASTSFKSYTLANPGSIDVKRSYLGWGSAKVSWNDLPWGSMGYAQLSMGRDRYREYSAQRLARSAFDRLLTGHLDPTDRSSTGKEQLDKRLQEELTSFLNDVFLPQDPSNPQPVDVTQLDGLGWAYYSFFNKANDEARMAVEKVRALIPIADGMPAKDWSANVRTSLNDYSTIPTELEQASYPVVYEYADKLADRFLDALESELSKVGLPYAELLLKNTEQYLQEKLIGDLRTAGSQAKASNPMVPPAQVEAILANHVGRGAVNQTAQIAGQIAETYYQQLANYFLGMIADRMYLVLDDFRINYLHPLSDKLSNVHQDLERAGSSKDVKINLADVATDDPVAWPKDSDPQIDDRFITSDNEILLTDTQEFVVKYEQHLLRTIQEKVQGLTRFEESVPEASAEIIIGKWDSVGGQKAPENTLAPQITGSGNRAGWVSKHLVKPPTGGENRKSARGFFDIKLQPTDLIDRSRQWVDRPGKPFADFITVDMRTYLTESDSVNRDDYLGRLDRLRQGFYLALRSARPLAAVDTNMLDAVHNVNRETYHFNFSEIPLKQLPAADVVQEVMKQDRTKDDATDDTFNSAFTDEEKVYRIEVFGSYPNYSPVVFSSLFPHIAKDWASRHGNAEGFWNLRRARPLPAALPLTEEERQAMVAGWLLGIITGKVFIANPGQPNATAHIWDDQEHEWVEFPPNLLTPPTQFKASIDWMPAVIESILLAYANVQNTPAGGLIGDSLRPYRLLRALYDNGEEGPTTGAVDHSSEELLRKWLATEDGPKAYAGDITTRGSNIAERYEAAKAILMTARQNAAIFLPTGGRAARPGSVAQDRPWANVTDRRTASKMPLYRDLAPDVDIMVADLVNKLESAKVKAETPTTPGFNAGPAMNTPGDDIDSGPVLPDFGGGVV